MKKNDVIETLKNFSNVETVTRDFSLTYKNAISEALPHAKQIVDRFHIEKNFTDDLCNYSLCCKFWGLIVIILI